jgi:pyridoxamine 5'-phosphate oxidase
MLPSVCAAPCAAVSHHVSGRAACPWRLYYTRYYSESRHRHQPAGRDSDPANPDLPLGPRIRDQRIWPRTITVGTIANIAHWPRWRETGRVDAIDLDADPLRQLATWLDAARAAGQPMPEAMTIASATSDAVPSARLVVLRGLRRGLVFFTDCESDKGGELAANPRAAAVLHWLVPAHRQVRVAGPVERVSEDEANEYWSTRAPAVRLSAAASHQSRIVASRAVLEMQVQDHLRRHPGGADVPRPRRWGGFRVLPTRVEFWQEAADGLHDRIRYRRANGGWIIERLSP